MRCVPSVDRYSADWFFRSPWTLATMVRQRPRRTMVIWCRHAPLDKLASAPLYLNAISRCSGSRDFHTGRKAIGATVLAHYIADVIAKRRSPQTVAKHAAVTGQNHKIPTGQRYRRCAPSGKARCGSWTVDATPALLAKKRASTAGFMGPLTCHDHQMCHQRVW